MKKPGPRRGKVRFNESLFEAEAAYADSMLRSALGDKEGTIAALKRCLVWMPAYAPALLTLGSIEYQCRRKGVGRALFQSLLSLPDDTPDLCEIINKAGDFLIQSNAYKDGLELYRAAAARFPDVAVMHQGVGCCAGHEGYHDEALAASKRALELEPENQEFVNDLGWTLLEAGRLAEAEVTLERAVAMRPSDELAQGNLRYCREKIAALAREEAARKPWRPVAQKRRGRGASAR